MSLGVGAYEVGGAGHYSSMRRRYPWQPCEWSPPGIIALKHFSGIVIDPVLT